MLDMRMRFLRKIYNKYLIKIVKYLSKKLTNETIYLPAWDVKLLLNVSMEYSVNR